MKKIRIDVKPRLNKKSITTINKEVMYEIKGGDNNGGGEAQWDFDFPTVNDNCFGGGGTTFKDACEWCGFFHSTNW